MKKLLATLALVLAISSVTMAKSSTKKSAVHHKKSQVCMTIFCDSAGHIIGMISSNGTQYGSMSGCVC